MNTITSLDKSKIHILALPDLNMESLCHFQDGLNELYQTDNIRIIALPIEIMGILSKEMSDTEFKELKEAIAKRRTDPYSETDLFR